MILATATDISTGARLGFAQRTFDELCSDLSAVPLSRAAAASSAVPLALSPVTLNNYGGTCKFSLASDRFSVFRRSRECAASGRARHQAHARTLRRSTIACTGPTFIWSTAAWPTTSACAACSNRWKNGGFAFVGQRSPFDQVRRIIVFIVNSLSVPKTNWDESERPPNDLEILMKATGVPIDHYSYEAVEQLRDTMARWQTHPEIRDSAAFTGEQDPELIESRTVPNIELYVITCPSRAEGQGGIRIPERPADVVRAAPRAVDRLRTAGDDHPRPLNSSGC